VFVATVVVDAIIGSELPSAGESQSIASAAIAALAINLLMVLLLSRPLGALLRRARPDLPTVVARNYAGTGVVLAVTVALLLAGLAHRAAVISDQNALRDAVARAQAWIGDRAPPEFRRDATRLDTYVIESGSVYRTCVPSMSESRSPQPGRAAREFCVIVKRYLPFSRSVSFAGYEPNAVFAEGLG
jgi:hypothetical protein